MSFKLIFFDTETTGSTEADYLCQLAYKTKDETFAELYKPPQPIPSEASAVHHITNKMVEEKSSFKESKEFPSIKEMFENKDAVAIAHNAPFDLMIIKKEGIEPKNFICTLRVARYLDPEEKLSQYKLQYLRYALDIEIEATAHDALGDVLVLEKLFERLRKKISEQYDLTEEEALQKMIEISSRPSLFRSMNFGKYKGMKIEEVAKSDPAYLEWLLSEKEKSDQNDEDWIYTLRHFLQKAE